ncbi:MAG: hypothetical protein QOE28_213 [Solirubrobacteraceae bacterium]|nr:hypothetical protein [Solirubrobacteraceae bacterium]
MIRASDRPVRRATQLLAGLVLFGLALAALVKADLGLDPWTVFNQGVARHTGLTIGEVTVIGSLLLLVLWIPLRQRPGIGTVANALIVGPVLDLGIAHLPTPGAPLVQVVYMLGGILASAVATGLYVGAGWGPGPRDGIMTGLHARGIPIPLARGGVEVTVLVVGFLLGGTVGIATVLFAVTIGPLVKPALQRLSVGPSRPDRPPRGRRRREAELAAADQA